MECNPRIIASRKCSRFLPANLRGKKEEIIVIPLQDTPDETKETSSFGSLHKYANPSLIPEEETAWEASVTERYKKPN